MRFWISQADVNNTATAQPASPAEGQCHIIQATHTGVQWAGFTPKDLAIFSGGTWYAFAPVEGNKVTVSGAIYVYSSGAWVAAGGGGGGAVDSVNGRTGAVVVPTCIPIACSDETTALTTGAGKVTFRMPFAMTGVTVRASLTTAQASGSILTVDVNEGGASILSTKLTIDNTEKTSTTAATPPVVSDAYGGRIGNIAAGDGWRYRGRSPIQITGRANYERVGDLMGQNLVGIPDLLSQPRFALEACIAWWEDKIPDSMLGETTSIRKRVNGGTLGLAEVKALTVLVRKALA